MIKMIKIFDGHNDTVTKLHKKSQSFFMDNAGIQLDLPKALRGGYMGGFFAIYTEPPPGSPELDPMHGYAKTRDGYTMTMHAPIVQAYAAEYSDHIFESLYNIEESSGGALKIIKKYADMESCMNDGIIMAIAHMEGAEAIKKDLSNLEKYYELGLRSLGLVWSRRNDFGTGVPFQYPSTSDTGPGLTAAGRELVAECNSMHMVVDLAHLNMKGFFDAAKISKAPLVVSHANVNSICPVARNLMDSQIEAVAATDGIIGINFEPSFVRPDGKPDANTPLDMIADHIEYIAKKSGIDHVGFGSDFDGTDMPADLQDASKLQNLTDALKERGFDGEDLEKIASKNWLRVLKASLK